MTGKKKKTNLSEQDAALWKQVAESVTPLKHGKGKAPHIARPAGLRDMQRQPRDLPPPPRTRAGRAGAMPSSTIPEKESRRIRRGRTEFDSVVDLHGMTQDAAHRRLHSHLSHAAERGERLVLVITGRGGKRFSQAEKSAANRTRADFEPEGGVLKRAVPQWLRGPDLSPFVISYEEAHQRHGGRGALYVRLRRHRSHGNDRL